MSSLFGHHKLMHRQRKSRAHARWRWVTLAMLLTTVLVSLLPFYIIYFKAILEPNGNMNTVAIINVATPPESLEQLDFCAEKCRYIPEMCTSNMYRDHLQLPAPTCLRYSTTIEDDIYWTSFKTESQEIYKRRNRDTIKLVSWAAALARGRRSFEPGQPTEIKCDEIPTSNEGPMMFPEEFEFIVKLFANAKPETYLEWGTGTSTSFYPLLVSGPVYAIDGYPPWCEKVMSEPRVHCMTADERRLHFYCPELTGADGITKVKLLETGRISRETPSADIETAMSIYVNSIDMLNVTSLDIVLVDGRFRLQCALKLLPYLQNHSVLLLHDFWVRKPYHEVLKYYNVIGYARSVVALRKKGDLSKEQELVAFQKFMTYDAISWIEVM